MTIRPRVLVGKPGVILRWIGHLNMPGIFDGSSSRLEDLAGTRELPSRVHRMARSEAHLGSWTRAVWLLAWIEAGILTVYGLVLTVIGMLVQAGAIHPSAGADHRASAWHAHLWDPWFLIWGLLVAIALWRARHHSQAEAHP